VPPLVAQLLAKEGTSESAVIKRAIILCEALNVAPRVGEAFGLNLLKAALSTYDQLPLPLDIYSLRDRNAKLLEKALLVAGHFDQRELVGQLLDRLHMLLGQRDPTRALEAIDQVAGQSFRGLRRFGMRDEIDRLLKRMTDQVLASQSCADLAAFQAFLGRETLASLDLPKWMAVRAMLRLAGEWIYFDRDNLAEPILEATLKLLLPEELPTTLIRTEYTKTICAYIQTLAQIPSPPIVQGRLETLLKKLKLQEALTTSPYYNLSQIQVLEALVLAVLTDDLSFGGEVRRLLDEEEFAVRRRVHRDVRTKVKV
jgi:hypothetical protein